MNRAVLMAGLLVWGSLATAGAAGRPAEVETTDGRFLKGSLSPGEAGWTLAAPGGAVVALKPEQIAHARFTSSARPSGIVVSGNTGGALPAGWRFTDIGSPWPAGEARFVTNAFHISGSGYHFWSRQPDSFAYVARTLRGDGELTVRLLDTEAKGAGLMIRASTKTNAPMAAMAVWKNMLVYRNRPGTNAIPRGQHPGQWLNRKGPNFPVWLRLTRRGNDVSGYVSLDDGVNWELFNEGPVELGRDAFAGMFVMGGTNETLAARFDQVVVTEYAKQPASNNLSRAALVLRDGTVVSGELRPMAGEQVVVRRAGRDFAIGTNLLARALFQTFATPTGGADLPDRAGLRIAKGDFLEGEFRSLDPSGVRMSSVIFGLKLYPLDKEAKALVLQAILPDPAATEIRTIDGSVWRGAVTTLSETEIEVRVAGLDAVRLRWDELTEVHRGASR